VWQKPFDYRDKNMRCAAYCQRIIRGKKKPHPEKGGKPEEKNEVFHVFLICVKLRNLRNKSALNIFFLRPSKPGFITFAADVYINHRGQEYAKEIYCQTSRDFLTGIIFQAQKKFYIFYLPLQTMLSDRLQSAQGLGQNGMGFSQEGLMLLLFSYLRPDSNEILQYL
jgi:hypothetical protein